MLRIAAFTHDTYGLGHNRRCLNIMRAVSEKAADSAILIVTACPALNLMSALPQNADVVKIPTFARTGDVHPRRLSRRAHVSRDKVHLRCLSL